MIKKIFIISVFTILFSWTGFVSFAQNKNDSTGQVRFLGKHSWKLIQLDGNDVSAYGAFINFDSSRGRITGFSSCNSFFVNYKFKKEQIILKNLGTTEKACMDNNLEERLYSLFKLNKLTYDLADQTFNIYHQHKLVAIFGMMEKQSFK